MKVKCINNEEYIMSLTIGKEYEVITQDDFHYRIKDNKGQQFGYKKERFEICKETNSNNERKVNKMNLKEKILAKLNMQEIAEKVYELLEDEIVNEIAYVVDEDAIAHDLVTGYTGDFLASAIEVAESEITENIDVDYVQDSFKEIVRDKLND